MTGLALQSGVSWYLGYIAKQTRQITSPVFELPQDIRKVGQRLQKEVRHAQHEWDYRP